MRISVVICTWNRCELLRQTLGAMTDLRAPAGLEWELLVVNNNCTDVTDEVVKSFDGRLPVRGLTEPRPGKSHALNRATTEARGEYVVFTDDDVLVDSDWLAAYADAFELWPDAAFFGGRIDPWFDGTPPAWLKEGIDVVYDAYAVTGEVVDAPILPSDERLPFGANMAVRADHQRAHPYDTRLGPRPGDEVRGEETALMRRLLAGGHVGRWVPGARALHFVPAPRQSLEYVRRWFHGAGQGHALQSGPAGLTAFGRPLWLWRQAIQAEVLFRAGRPFMSPTQWLGQLRLAGLSWGRISGYPREASD